MTNLIQLQARLWESANSLRANSSLKLHEFSEPVLGIIFLKFANVKFQKVKKEIEINNKPNEFGRTKQITELDYQARGVIYLPENAQYNNLLSLPAGNDLGKLLNEAMKDIEEKNPDLRGILPKSYTRLENDTIIELLKNFNQIPDDIEGDAFGMIYEYFLGKFAMSEGQKGGEFFTPTSIVKLIVNILEPYKGRVYDPACGSGGMFVQSLEFIKAHTKNKEEATKQIAIYGQEKTGDTVRIAKMNLAIHGLSGDIREGNTYYEDFHDSFGKFDFVMANPPFNVKKIDSSKIVGDKRFSYGIPTTDNGNYLWIQIFWYSLNENGRSGFVMANSASDARGSEASIRQRLIEDNGVDVMVSVGANMFFNVTLPCTLWFLDKNKKNTPRKDKILFIDAKNIFRQIDRAHRDWTDEQIQQIADIVRSYRQEEGTKPYENIPGLCKVATLEEVKAQGYSLNAGRYVGIGESKEEEYDFKERLEELTNEFKTLTQEAHKFEDGIIENVGKLLL